MIHGLDTGYMVATEVIEHADHGSASSNLTQMIVAGDSIAIAPQVLAEFVHVVTDARRFTQPLDIAKALEIAEKWWTARETIHVYPNDDAVRQYLIWLQQFSLGRKRLLDTLLAATYRQVGIQSLLTTNPGDFAVFGVFTCIMPNGTKFAPRLG